MAQGRAKIGYSLAHVKQGGWGCGLSSRFNKREDISYYGYKGALLRDVNDENIWDVGAFGEVRHTLEVKGRGWVVGDQIIKLL